MRLAMHGDGGADMAWDAVKGLADEKLMSAFRFEHEVLFTLHDRRGVWQLFKAHARMRILRCHGLVAEIEREAVFARLADDASEESRSRQEGQIGVLVPIAKVPQDGPCASHARQRWANHLRRVL